MNVKIVLLILLAFIISLLLSYFQNLYKEPNRYRYQYLLFWLRTISFFLILLLLINPKIKHRTMEISKPVLSILVDNSSSLKYAKMDSLAHSILERFKNDREIHKKFDVTCFGFGNTLEMQDEFDFSKERTNLYHALTELDKLYKNTHTNTILISDGIQNYGKNYVYYRPEQVVYPIVIGDTTKYTDLLISNLNVNAYTYEGHHFPIEVFIDYEGVENIRPTFHIYHKNKVVYTQKLHFSKNNKHQHLTLKLPALNKGKQFYRADITRVKEDRNTNNNVFNFSVDVLDEKTKILLIHDILHPDIAFWKRSVESNEQRKLDIRNISEIVPDLNDYNFVILYQPNANFKKIFEHIQEKKMNFILHTGIHTDWDFLNRNQSFLNKNYLSEQQEVYPILNDNFSTFQLDDIGFKNLPPLKNMFGAVDMKVPYESLLFQGIQNIHTKSPLIASFKDKDQKGIVLFGEDIYRWRIYTSTLSKTFKSIDNFTNSLFQYLQTNPNKKRLNVLYEPFYYSDQDIDIRAQFYDANYNPDRNTPIEIEFFKDPVKKKIYPLNLRNNTMAVNLKDIAPGTYHFNVRTKDGKQQYKGEFSVLEFSVEQQNLQANMEALQELANNSNGKLYTPVQVQNLIDYLLISKDFPSVQKEIIKTDTIINWKWLLFLIVLSLILEWFVRKYNGLI